MLLFPIPHAREALRLLFSLPRDRVDRDIEWALRAKCQIGQALCRYVARYHIYHNVERTAAESAAYLHNMMLLAVAIWKDDEEPEEFAAHHALQGAKTIAQVAIDTALESGKPKELNDRLNAILDAAGLTKDDIENGQATAPVGYAAVRDQLADIFIGIEAVMAPDTLRRYGLDEFAERFEENPDAFEAFAALGERMVNRSATLG